MKGDYLRNVFLVFGVLFLLSGFCLTSLSAATVTGYSISYNEFEVTDGFLGIFLFFTGIFLIKKSRKKGQAAIEFLMTYGWAILAAVLALGTLAYMGIFGGSFNTQTVVILNPPFYSSASNIETFLSPADNLLGSRIGVEFSRNDGKAYNIMSIFAKSRDGQTTCSFESDGGLYVSPNQKETIYLICDVLNGKKFEGDITISYKTSGSNLIQTTTGTLSGSIIERTSDSFCGNNLKEGSEFCDGITSCAPYSGDTQCNLDCTAVEECDEFCGDGKVNGDEQCDGNPESCDLEGGETGTAQCLPGTCLLDVCVPDEGGGDAGQIK